jgi:putative glutathione S-transferase
VGEFVDGVWREGGFDVKASKGTFVRRDAAFRSWVTADGSSGFKAEAGRYHLYVSAACPWAHRTLIFRVLKGLAEAVSLSVVDPLMGPGGWHFSDGPGCIPDTVNGSEFLRQVYTKADPRYTGRVTVPVLWDRETRTIVNNESSEIIRMFNHAFDDFGDASVDFHPADLREAIEDVNRLVYETVNNGVYRCGFAVTQAAYEDAFDALFETLDGLEERLSRHAYLVGDRLTEADWRLFTTLVRFDSVYHGHFKCNARRLVEYPNLWAYTRQLYQVPGVAGTVDMDHIKRHYHMSHASINPTRVVPKGPQIDFTTPHGRDGMETAA